MVLNLDKCVGLATVIEQLNKALYSINFLTVTIVASGVVVLRRS